MTAPTLTCWHGYLTDCDTLTGWSTTNSGLAGQATSIESNDRLKLLGEPNDVGNEYCYLARTANDLTINASIYDKWMFRAKTEKASNGLGVGIQVMYSDATSEYIGLDGANPRFGTEWFTQSGTLVSGSGKTIYNVRFIADDYPNTAESYGSTYVLYDFLIFYRKTFTFPFVSDGTRMHLSNAYPPIRPPGRVGNIHQYLGMDSPPFTLKGVIDTNTNWHDSDDAQDLGDLLNTMHRAYDSNQPWVWLTIPNGPSCKVVPKDLDIFWCNHPEHILEWELSLEMYSASPGNDDTWAGLDWFGI